MSYQYQQEVDPDTLSWPDDFSDLDPVICDSPMCENPAAYGANVEYDWRQVLFDPHYTKWCRDFNQRSSKEEDPPERLSFEVYFAEAVSL